MKLLITGKSVFMEFEHVATDDKSANKFIKQMMSINRQCALEANPKPERVRRKRARFPWRYNPTQNDTRIDAWRERNKEYRLILTIERA